MSLRDVLSAGNREKQEEVELRRAYNLLFTSLHGRKVLAHMLAELHFFDEIVTEDERVLSNYAKRLLSNIGVMQGFSVPLFVESVLRIPITPPEDAE